MFFQRQVGIYHVADRYKKSALTLTQQLHSSTGYIYTTWRMPAMAHTHRTKYTMMKMILM